MNRWIYIWFIGLVLGPGSTGAGVTYYVASNGTHGAAGTSWDTAVKSFTQAVAKAAADSGDVILVSNGTYTAWDNGGYVKDGITNLVYLEKGATLRSLQGPVETILDCGGILNNRAIYANAAHAMMDGFTITNGNVGTANGGGLYLNNAQMVTNCVIANCAAYAAGGLTVGVPLLIANCVFRDNAASAYGGGFYTLVEGPLIFSNCTFAGNMAGASGGGACYLTKDGRFYGCVFSNNATSGSGGGITTEGVYTGVVERCWFVTNRANHGGGMYLTSAGRVRDCDFVGNVATNQGGGLRITSTNSVVTDCRIMSNLAMNQDGGGVMNAGLVSNCAINGNTAFRNGGGIYMNLAGNPGGWAYNCIIASNTAGSAGIGGGVYSIFGGELRNCLVTRNVGSSGNGGGMYVNCNLGRGANIQSCTIVSNSGGGISVDGRSNTVVNCIIYSNAAVDVAVSPAACTNWFTNCCTLTGSVLPPVNGNITANPLFVNFASDNYRLSLVSSCREAGTNQPWMGGNVDLSGQARIRYDCVDIGAYEWFPNLKVNGIPAGKWKYINGRIPRSINGVPVP